MKLVAAVLVCAIAYLFIRILYRRHWDEGLLVHVDFPDRIVREGEMSTLNEVITNDKWLPLPILQVKFSITRSFLFSEEDKGDVTDNYYRNEYFSLRSFERISRTYRFRASRRGLFSMRGMDLVCRDLFMKDEHYDSRDQGATLLVLPGRVPERNIPQGAKRLLGEIETKTKLQDDPFSFASIREYQSGDPMRSINWKLTAREDRLMVNTFHTTVEREVVIVINLNTHHHREQDRVMEGTLRIAATLAAMCLKEKIPVGILSNGRDILSKEAVWVAPGADPSHIHTLENALARIDTSLSREEILPVLEKRIRDHVQEEYLLLSNDADPALQKSLARLIRTNPDRLHLICPCMKYDERLSGLPAVYWDL